jgi:ribokinase
MTAVPTILTFGSVNVDVIARSSRLPRPGETLHGERYTMSLGGKGANQAAAVARLGCRSVLIGRIGADAFGALARERLAAIGVEQVYLREDKSGTGVALIVVDAAGENSIVVISGANGAVSQADAELARDTFSHSAAVLLQFEVPQAASLAAAKIARDSGAIVILDPAPAPASALPPDFWTAVDIVTPNETETQALTGVRPGSPSEAQEAASRLRALGAKCAVIKMGAQGAYWSNASGHGHVPPFPVEAVNSVGAGDSFNGALAVALTEGATMADAVRFACAGGALATTGSGGAEAAPGREAVLHLLRATR